MHRSHRLPMLFASTFLMLLGAVIALGFWGFSYDDAFITYRYAANLASGLGLVFNPGEAVLGTTAPGFAVVLAGLSRLGASWGMEIPHWGTLLCLVSLLVPAGLVLRHGVQEGESVAIPVALFGGLALLSQWNLELLGAEAFPVTALIASAIYLACEERRELAAGLLLAAAMFLRLDAAVGAAAVGFVLWAARRRFPWRLAVAGLAPLAPWLAWLWLRFGSFVPHSLGGKRAELEPSLPGYSLAEWTWLRRSLPLSSCLVLLGLALLALYWMASRGLWRRPSLQALGAWIAGGEIFYRTVGVPFAPWYHVATFNLLLGLASFGAFGLALRLGRGFSARLRPARVFLLAGLALLPIVGPEARYVSRQWRRAPDPRYDVYAEVGRYLASRPGKERVATVEIGIVGYLSGKPILDEVGLVSPGALEARGQGRLAEHVLETAPEIIVDTPLFRSRFPLLDHPGIASQYETIASFPDPHQTRGTIRVLRRRE